MSSASSPEPSLVPSPAIPPAAEPTGPAQSEHEASLSLVAQLGREPPLTTPAELVACLGGEHRIAKETMTSIEGVRDWIEKDFIPNGLHLRFFVRAIAAGRSFDQHGMHRLFGIKPEITEAIAGRSPWCLSTDPAPPSPAPFWERNRLRADAAEAVDLTYRPEPMLLTSRQLRMVSPELRELMDEREKLRVAFVNLQAVDDPGEEDALSDLNGANDDVLMFEPKSVGDLAVIVAMARHQIEASEIREDFLEPLLSAIERLVLVEVGHE